MKSNAKSKIIILITLGIVFGLSLFIITNNILSQRNNYTSSEYSDEINLDNENLKISAVSGKIHIINNSGWVDFRNAGNCTGNGTYSEPYVIEDLLIDGGGSGSCILIENSDVYFIIKNCTVYNSGRYSGGYTHAGIKLSNVTNAQLINNDCSSNHDGIHLIYSNNNTISGNAVSNSERRGIQLDSSDTNTISGNTANNNYWDGIYLDSSNNNAISGNTANNNNLSGIDLYSSDNNTISGNTLIGNDVCIYKDENSNSNVFENNYCRNRLYLSILYLIIPLTILFTALPLTMTGMIIYEKRKHSTFPMYGTIALVFDMLGLLILLLVAFSRANIALKIAFTRANIEPNYYIDLIATPFTIVGLICGYLGYKSKRDTTPVLGMLGVLLGIVQVLFISIYPILGVLTTMGFGF